MYVCLKLIIVQKEVSRDVLPACSLFHNSLLLLLLETRFPLCNSRFELRGRLKHVRCEMFAVERVRAIIQQMLQDCTAVDDRV